MLEVNGSYNYRLFCLMLADERDRKFKKESVTTTTAANVAPTTSNVCQIPATSTMSQRRFSPDQNEGLSGKITEFRNTIS